MNDPNRRACNIAQRVHDFRARFGVTLPIVMAPMAGACPPELAAAVASAGGMGGCGALLDAPETIASWVARFRSLTDGNGAGAGDGRQLAPLQINLWIPDPPPARDAAHEARLRDFLERVGGEPVPEDAFERAMLCDFASQCETLLDARPSVVSSIMGLYPSDSVERLHAAGIAWFACATTVDEARRAAAAGADAIVAQGMEAGGHRGTFNAARAREERWGCSRCCRRWSTRSTCR